MSSRIPVTLRVAVLALLLALLSNLAVLGFIRWRTHDDALGMLRQSVLEQAAALDEMDAAGDRRALVAAVRRLLAAGDPQLLVALLDAGGRPLIGNVETVIPAELRAGGGIEIAALRRRDTHAAEEAAFIVRHLRDGGWLLSGRGFGERAALQHTLERSLALAVILSLLFGAVCGLVTARYVGARVRAIADVVDAAGEGNLARRAPIGPAGDAFDVLSARVNHMLERVGALMAELRLLTDSLAHDLRSPVGRLRARIERALTTADEAQRDAMLAGVLQEADALMRMLTTVLEIGRSEALTGRERFAPIGPAELVAELAEMYEPLAEEAGMALTHAASGALGPISGHRQLLAQALSNLVDNALRYAASGGEILLFARCDGDALRLGVADRGPGIAVADRAAARRRFGRLDASRSVPGAGLGLALVEAVAHLHRGRLELADNAPGLEATIVIPARAAA